jgi:hypothetical protein
MPPFAPSPAMHSILALFYRRKAQQNRFHSAYSGSRPRQWVIQATLENLRLFVKPN